jgi:hypothetical protein
MQPLRQALIVAIAASSGIALAAEPTTRPRDVAPSTPPAVEYAAPIADYTRPAYVPAFLEVTRLPALQAERDHALTHQPPSPIVIPFPCGPVWCRPYGTIGYVPNHGFMR